MKYPHPKAEIRNAIWLWAVLWEALVARAASDSAREEEAFKLSPPYAELPPTFWEQHGLWVVLGAIVLVALVLVAAWRMLRPKPCIPVPVEVQARKELEALRQRSEDGRLLSQVSRGLRRYVVGAFALPSDELTTTEFCRVIAAHERLGPDLAAQVAEFLHRCDELKFAPASSPTPIGAAARALELVELGESRRAHLRKLEAEAAATQPATHT